MIEHKWYHGNFILRNSGKRIINPKDVIELFCDKKEEKRDKAAHVIQKTWKRWLVS